MPSQAQQIIFIKGELAITASERLPLAKQTANIYTLSQESSR